jgi:hypothetical protein
MVQQGAAIGILDDINLTIALGVVILDEPAKQLLFMEIWAVGTGGAHVLDWERVQQLSNQVLFFKAAKLHFSIAPLDEWMELDQDIYHESFVNWKLELAAHRKDYQRFCRNEFRLLSR